MSKLRKLSLVSMVALCWAVLAGTAGAQSETNLKAFFEGKKVVVSVAMPASSDGIDVYPAKDPPFDSSKIENLGRRTGVAIRRGQESQITLVKTKKKHIEFHLDGGGWGTYGDRLQPYQPAAKSQKELDYDARCARETDRRRAQYYCEEAAKLRKSRESRDSQRKAEHERQALATRLTKGSRFNIRYDSRLTPEQMTPESVMAALSDLVGFYGDFHAEEISILLSQAEDQIAKRRFQEATASFQQILQLDPNHREASLGQRRTLLHAEAASFFDAGDYALAIGTWQKLLRTFPGDLHAFAMVQEALTLRNQAAEKAVEEVEETPAEPISRNESTGDTAAETPKKADPQPDPVSLGPGEKYAVVIGIADYEDTNIPALHFTDDDARGLYEILTDPEVGGFAEDNVRLLINSEATARNIKEAIGTWLKRMATEADTVVIYFAGHGAPEGPETYWLTYDANIDDLYSSALSNQEIAHMLGRVNSKRIISFIDSCYSAATINSSNTRGVVVGDPFEEFKGEGRVTITSSNGKQESLELPEYGHGVFTHFLLQGLQGEADRDDDGRIVLDEVWDYVKLRVPEEAQKHGIDQTPVLDGSYSAGIVLSEVPQRVAEQTLLQLLQKGELALDVFQEALDLLGRDPEPGWEEQLYPFLKRLAGGEISVTTYLEVRRLYKAEP